MDEKKPIARKRERPVVKPVSDGHDPHKPVGYANPPKSTQFKKGQSGNPKGRPKGHKNSETIMREQLYKMISVREQGRVKKVPVIQALSMEVIKSALAGDKAARALVFKLIDMVEKGKRYNEGSSSTFSAEEDAKLLAEFQRMQLGSVAEEGS